MSLKGILEVILVKIVEEVGTKMVEGVGTNMVEVGMELVEVVLWRRWR